MSREQQSETSRATVKTALRPRRLLIIVGGVVLSIGVALVVLVLISGVLLMPSVGAQHELLLTLIAGVVSVAIAVFGLVEYRQTHNKLFLLSLIPVVSLFCFLFFRSQILFDRWLQKIRILYLPLPVPGPE